MEIHWSVWIGLGLAISVASSVIEKMSIFIVFGVLFIAIGVVKWIMRKSSKKSERTQKTEEKRPERKYVKCRHCKAWNYPHVRVCHHCKKSTR